MVDDNARSTAERKTQEPAKWRDLCQMELTGSADCIWHLGAAPTRTDLGEERHPLE